jgi:isocitrate dehydrogenase
MNAKTPITIAYGDGIGPEIMKSVVAILDAAGAGLSYEVIQIGKTVYEKGFTSGIEPSSWESLRRTKVFLKSPITTPQGGGFKSLNVTIRKTLGLFANVRPCVSYYPVVQASHPKMDLVIIRENEEDLYAGIEHRQTQDVVQCLKILSHSGCEKIIRYAFEYAVQHNRKKVSCFSKDNIMKLTDGMFHRIFDAVAKEYPNIATDHYIIDIGTARLATRPQDFDVIVTLNLYGDIISDVAAEVNGSVGLAGSANIGDYVSMFEAIHGSAPDIAGKNIANPTGLLQSAVMMLVHLGKYDVAATIQNALLKTLEDGIHTGDIYQAEKSSARVGTGAFTEAVIARLGQEPSILKPARFSAIKTRKSVAQTVQRQQERVLVGIDVFIASQLKPDDLAAQLTSLQQRHFTLSMLSNRGVKVWPGGFPETYCTDLYRCRFEATPEAHITNADILALLGGIHSQGIEFVKTEQLYTFDGQPGYSLGQGQ